MKIFPTKTFKELPVFSITLSPAEIQTLVYQDQELLAVFADTLGVEEPSMLTYRGTNIRRLPNIINYGCDVYPDRDFFFCGNVGRAMKYNGGVRVIQIFDKKLLDRSYRIINKANPPSDLERLKEIFPHAYEANDGLTTLISKVPPDSTYGFGYEEPYGYWIPGDPIKALRGLLLLQVEGDIIHGLYDQFFKEKRPDLLMKADVKTMLTEMERLRFEFKTYQGPW